MRDELLDDLGIFFDGLDAIQVEAACLGGGTRVFAAYLDAGEMVYGFGSDFDLQSADSVLTCESCDAVCLDRGCTVLVGDAAYTVERVLADGSGISRVILSDGAVEAY